MAQVRWDARTDKNQQEIIDALREAGALVFYVRVPFDLLVAYRGQLILMEVKSGSRGFSRKQADTCKELMLRGVVPALVRTPEEALRAIGALEET